MEGDGEFYTPQSIDLRFLSTPSAWRATRQVDEARRIAEISIHALRMEGDAPA